ncbi:MAG: hypothetical protein ACI35P_18810 [Bacillus sp. (in: firmicutes)]
MRNGEHRGSHKEKHQRGEGHKRRDEHPYKRGAKTFRRGKAIAFLEMLQVKRSTLKQQLHSPELQSINPVIVGELKAIEMVIDEFTQLFHLYEDEEVQAAEETSSSTIDESQEDTEKESD